MKSKKILFIMLSVVLLLVAAHTNSEAVPPMPYAIYGTVTVNGEQLTQATDTGYTFIVTKQDSTAYVPAAEDTDGLNASDMYIIKIPLYDAIDQPGGAQPGETAVIHVYLNGSETDVTLPNNGEFQVGNSGGTGQINIVAGICIPTSEICDGIDNDCDPNTPDGSDENWYGTNCDGDDSDLCDEGTFQCTSGSKTCSDNTGDNLELCDGIDNDCNAGTEDGSGENWIGTNCDGADSDLCDEGEFQCTSGSKTCSDNTGDNLELCDGNDNDCNAGTEDGSDEAWYGTNCDGADSDLCEEGIYECSNTVKNCTDNTGDNVELCDNIDNDCNGEIDDNIVTDTYCYDGDGDTYGDPNNFEENCKAEGGYVLDCNDCNDGNGSINPGADELCDNVDNDCDDVIDLFTRSTTCGVGACAGNKGEETCTAGAWGSDTCDPFEGSSSPDLCDGVDNNCDGNEDEDYVPTDTDCGTGECASTGQDICQGGNIVDTCVEGNPAPDDNCNAKDEDCDDEIDEHYEGETVECGLGECVNNGQIVCDEGKLINGCKPLAPGTEQYGSEGVCSDGLDNDCDGGADASDPDCGEVKVIPNSIDFGCVDTNSTETVTLTVINRGDTDVVLGDGGITGPDALQFDVQNIGCEDILAAGESCSVDVICMPDSEGIKTATVGTDGVNAVSIALRCKAIDSNTDLDDDCVPDDEECDVNDPGCNDDDNDEIANADSATGTGSVTVDISGNDGTSLSDVQCLSDGDAVLNQAGKPSGFDFPHGVVSFKVAVPNDGDSATVKLTFPSLPANAKYYKVDDDGFYEYTAAVFDYNDNSVTLPLTDGGIRYDGGDDDRTANSVISEPGGVGVAADDPDPDPDTSSSSGGGSGKCFIATAAYGSYMASEVMDLREFRDNYLMTNSIGKILVTDVYYRYSPPIADYIAEHESLRTATRVALTPVVYSVNHPFIFMGMMALGMVVVLRRSRRRK